MTNKDYPSCSQAVEICLNIHLDDLDIGLSKPQFAQMVRDYAAGRPFNAVLLQETKDVAATQKWVKNWLDRYVR